MFTIHYHGYWIHGFYGMDPCRVQCPDFSSMGMFRNLRAAKRAIRRAIEVT